MISEEGGKGVRCPHCTVVEGVQKDEREKYRKLLERLKEGGHGSTVPPTVSHDSSQRIQMDTLKTKGWVEEQIMASEQPILFQNSIEWLKQEDLSVQREVKSSIQKEKLIQRRWWDSYLKRKV